MRWTSQVFRVKYQDYCVVIEASSCHQNNPLVALPSDESRASATTCIPSKYSHWRGVYEYY